MSPRLADVDNHLSRESKTSSTELATVGSHAFLAKDAASGNSATKSLVAFFPVRRAMPKKTREPFAAGGLDDPAKQFREFAAECLELDRDTASPEKRRMYLEMARVWYQMARRWEKRLQTGRPSRRHQSFE